MQIKSSVHCLIFQRMLSFGTILLCFGAVRGGKICISQTYNNKGEDDYES